MREEVILLYGSLKGVLSDNLISCSATLGCPRSSGPFEITFCYFSNNGLTFSFSCELRQESSRDTDLSAKSNFFSSVVYENRFACSLSV